LYFHTFLRGAGGTPGALTLSLLYLLLPPTTTETEADAEVAVTASHSSRGALHLTYVSPDLPKIVCYSLMLKHFATFHSRNRLCTFYFVAGLQVALAGDFTEDLGAIRNRFQSLTDFWAIFPNLEHYVLGK